MGRVADQHEEPLTFIDEVEEVLELRKTFSWEDWMGR